MPDNEGGCYNSIGKDGIVDLEKEKLRQLTIHVERERAAGSDGGSSDTGVGCKEIHRTGENKLGY